MNRGKRFFDLFWTLPGIILLLVPGLVVAAAVIIDDGWPPLYAQERVGLHGRPFTLLKFRSMRKACDSPNGRLTVETDSRITGVGRVLRRTKLDELPQLLNVLRGDMSLVGPRPEVPEFVRQYSLEQRDILELLPGITDPASTKYADESDILALHANPYDYYITTIMPDKIRISIEYARRATMISDFLVVVETVFGRGRVRGGMMALRVKGQNGWMSAIGRLALDVIVFNLATILAVLARLDFGAPPWPYVYTLRFPGLVENLVLVAASVLLQTPFALWSYASLRDVERVALVVGITKLLVLPFLVAMREEIQWSRGALAASAVLAFLFMAGVRATVRWRYEHDARSQRGGVALEQSGIPAQVLVVGAGEAGDKILREFESHRGLGTVVGLVDDDPAKRGCTLRGVRVLGPVASIADAVARTGATQVVIAIPSRAAVVTRRVVSSLADTRVQVRTLPTMSELVNGSVHFDDLRSVQLEDLLVRSPVAMDTGSVQAYVEGKHVLVTGAGGSIGSEIVRQVAALRPAKLIMLGRGENRIFSIDREIHDQRRSVEGIPVIGDMRDEARMSWLFDIHRPDIVFHAAAHKHVPLMEQNPEEAILNNVGGTRTLLRLAASHGTTRFVNISTDKAVDPINFMGASKRVVELMVQVNDGRESLRATSVRFGNVLGSQGSVTEVFRDQLKESRTLRVTDPNMERFFMLIPEAVHLVLQAGALAQGRDIYVLRMGEPIRILDLARSYIKLAGLEVGVDADIVITGNRGNEKMTEELWTPLEHVVPTTNENILRVECPAIPDLAVLRQAIDNLLNAARSHDADAMREALHAVDPAINIPQRLLGDLLRGA